VYINDLPKCIKSKCSIFADDTNVYNIPDQDNVLQKDIVALQKWTEDWQIEFNVDKCSIIHLGSNNIGRDYEMNANSIKTSIEEKDLGVLIDNKLHFRQHIENITNSANKMLGIIKRNFKNLTRKSFVMLYKALVRSKLEYANAIWSPLFKEDNRKIERAQRRATKCLNSRIKHMKKDCIFSTYTYIGV